MYPFELAFKDTTESNNATSYLDVLLLNAKVNFTLSLITNATISISISQTFQSLVAVFYHHRPIGFSSNSLYDMLGFTPHVNVLS